MAAPRRRRTPRPPDRSRAGRPHPEPTRDCYRRSHSMRRFVTGVMLLSSVTACAVPKAAGAPLAPVERAWEVPTLELYSEWWRKTEACSGRKGDMSQVTFYAVDAPERRDRAQRHASPTAGGCGRATGSTSPPTRWARSGWCATRCSTPCSSAARTPTRSSSRPATSPPSRYGGTRRCAADPANPQGR